MREGRNHRVGYLPVVRRKPAVSQKAEGIPRATFYRWCDHYREGGIEALADHRSKPDRVWNRIPDDIRGQIIHLPLELPELSPRELAVRFTGDREYFVSEASVYRLLKAHDLITSPPMCDCVNLLWQPDAEGEQEGCLPCHRDDFLLSIPSEQLIVR